MFVISFPYFNINNENCYVFSEDHHQSLEISVSIVKLWTNNQPSRLREGIKCSKVAPRDKLVSLVETAFTAHATCTALKYLTVKLCRKGSGNISHFYPMTYL